MTEATISREGQLAAARYQLEKTLLALSPLDRTVRSIPEERLGERPVPGQYPIGVLIAHAYQAVAMMSRAALHGHCDEEDMAELPDPERVGTSHAGLAGLGTVARESVQALLERVDEDHVTRSIAFYFGYEASGLDAINIAYAELLHHRGQVQSFLRLMGLEPQDVYDATPA